MKALTSPLILLLGILFFISCKKDPERIDSFVAERTGTYFENDCGTGGVVTGSITLEDTKLSITKSGAESAQIVCSHSVAGELFRCQGNVQSDTSLTITTFELDGKTFDGEYIIRPSGTINLYLYNSEIECIIFGKKGGNLAWLGNL